MINRYLAIGAGVLVLLLAVSGWLLKSSYEANGILQAAVKSRDAVIAQKEADAKLSAEILAHQAAALTTLSIKATRSIQQVFNAPQTRDCGPVMRASSRSVRELFAGPDLPPAGRQPAPAVR